MKGRGTEVRKLRNTSEWSRARKWPLWRDCVCCKQLLVFAFKNKNVCLFPPWIGHSNLCYSSQCHRQAHSHPSSQLQNSHVTRPGLRSSAWLVPIAHRPRWTEWRLRSWGALIFCHRVFTRVFIKNSNPSGKSGREVFHASCHALLYMTLSIKEETLLKQTEVKLVLSSTSDLPLLLSSKRKFVLEQW